MKLLDEIIDLAVDDEGSIATLLRKCLVLAHTLKNDRLKEWAEKELNGYDNTDAVPEYRITGAIAKGSFLGPLGTQIHNQPLPAGVLHEKHRHFAESVKLMQPIVAYDTPATATHFVLEWPPDLTAMYQRRFVQHYVLNRAWQEIASSVFPCLIDTVRTRVLRFALELKDDLGQVDDNPDSLPSAKLDQYVTTYIFGGTNIVASKDFTQIGNIEIDKGDWSALNEALKGLGIPGSETSKLKSALDQDSTGETAIQGLGQRTATWLKQLGSKLGQVGISVGIEVAKKEATKWISQFLGLHD
jgi:hypothetical protein